MSLISSFEILVKPIAPTTGLPPAVSAAFRRVVQGYFLNIANINLNRNLGFILRVRIPVSNPPDPFNREFTNTNHTVAYDIAGANNFSQLVPYGTFASGNQLRFRTELLSLPRGQTASLQILPDTLSILAAAGAGDPNFEVRGYIELVQAGFFFPIGCVPSIDIITTPEIRGTILDNAYPTFNLGDELDFDQISYSLPTCNGQSCQTISEYVTLPIIIHSPLGGGIGTFDFTPTPNMPVFNRTGSEVTLMYPNGTIKFNRAKKDGQFKVSRASMKTVGDIIRKRKVKVVQKKLLQDVVGQLEVIVNRELGDVVPV